MNAFYACHSPEHLISRRRFLGASAAGVLGFRGLVAPAATKELAAAQKRVLVVFLAGIVRVPTSALQLARIVPSQDPAWYVVLEVVVGLIQFVIAITMLVGYRKAGVWGIS